MFVHLKCTADRHSQHACYSCTNNSELFK